MDIQKIVQRAWEITKANHFMWWLGFLALFTGQGGVNILSFNNGRATAPTQGILYTDIPRALRSAFSSPRQNLLRGASPSDTISRATAYISSHIPLISLCVLVALIITILILYISYSARAGMILAANDIEEKLNLHTKNYFLAGARFAWRLVGLYVLTTLFFVGVLLVLAVPGYFVLLAPQRGALGSVRDGLIIGLIIYTLISLVLIGSCAIYLAIFKPIASRSIVLHHARLENAMRDTYELIHFHSLHICIIWAVTLLIDLVYGIIRAGVFIIIALIGGLFAASIYSVGGIGGTLLLIAPALIIIVCIFAVLGGVYQAFLSTYWTLTYRALYYTYTHKS